MDYKGAFDAFNRTTLSRVLSLFLPPCMVHRTMALYLNAGANVHIKDITGIIFELFCDVHQGCPALPSFFTITLAFVSWSFRNVFRGIRLITFYLRSIGYVDNQIQFTLSPSELQDMITYIAETALPFGLRLAPQKCKLICFHRPVTIDKNSPPRIVQRRPGGALENFSRIPR